MNIIEKYLKRRAIRSYINKLPRLLAKDYGRSKTYTPLQVRRTIERAGLNTVYSCYGISMFSSREDFDQFHFENGESCNYDVMRSEIGHSHFSGNAEFTFADIFESSSHHETYTDHGSFHDSGGHDHGGH